MNNNKVLANENSKLNMDNNLKSLQSVANDFLNYRRHANNLSVLLTYFEEALERKEVLGNILHTLEVVFTQLLKRGDLKPKKKSESDEGKYNRWLGERYEEFWILLIRALIYLQNTQSLKTCMNLIAAEGIWPIDDGNSKRFPRYRLQRVLNAIVSVENTNNTILLQHFREYAKHLDVIFYAWQSVLNLVNNENFKKEKWAVNFLQLIGELAVTDELLQQADLLCPSENPQEIYAYKKIRNCINRVWHNLVSWSSSLPEAVIKQMLIVTLERILPHFDKPLLLTDFLMDSLECGGAISLLSLQGVFTLMQKHNITYPHIYDKLYSLFEVQIFGTKYKARLFFLADVFLSSTHLPEKLVAGFIKRLARLTLIAPPQDIIIIIYFITNLLLRHPELKKLLRADVADEVENDPFIMEENKPENSRAIESSLWELIILQQHVLPIVAAAARALIKQLPITEWNLSDVLDISENDIFNPEEKDHNPFSTNFERPVSLFLLKSDKVEERWDLL